MLIALMMMHLFGGGGAAVFASEDFQAIESNVEDQERAAAAVASMERANALFESLVESRQRSFEQLSQIDLEQESGASSYESILNELSTVRAEARKQYIEEIFVLRGHVQREEWASAFGQRYE